MKTTKIIFLVMIFLSICFIANAKKDRKKKAEQPKVEVSSDTLYIRPLNLVTWVASMHQNLNVKEKIFFYNTYKIMISGTLPKIKDLLVKDGGFVNQDTVLYFAKPIPPFTPGRVEDIQRDATGTMIGLRVSFDLSDRTFKLNYLLEDYARAMEYENQKTDPSIQLNPVKDSGSFILSSDAQIVYKGQEAKASAAVVGTKEDDRLLVKLTGTPHSEVITDGAKVQQDG
ncbi:hypothetical protein HXX01_04400, partial [Candidatus Nomurabacteria bacterium]|nr:hypothetical protein [Candidatus Nomurabacteria bacterium]